MGLLLDTFLIRPVLTPVVLALLGRAVRWPSRTPRPDDPTAETLATDKETTSG